MINKLFAISLVAINVASFGCSSNNRQNAQPKIEIVNTTTSNQTKQSKTPTGSGKVDFKSVSFNYNPQIFDEIKPQEVEASPMLNETDKPGAEYPRHISFDIKLAGGNQKGTLKILPIEDYKKMYAISKSYTDAINENFADLKKIIKDTNFRLRGRLRNGEIPFIEFYDAHQTFQAKVKKFSFQNGQGIFFLTQINQEALLISNELTYYYFQGITNDEKYYILAEFPIKVSFLPDNYDADEFEGYKLSASMNDAEYKLYKEYLAKVTKRLEDLPPDDFQPNLKYFEEIISNLKIEK